MKNQLYLRQTWIDPRLTFEVKDDGGHHQVKLSDARWSEIWLPDTFFRNEKTSSFHMMTEPNRLIYIESNGLVYYTAR